MSDASNSSVSSGSIRRSTRTRKKKKSQLPFGIIAGAVIVILGVLLSMKDPKLGLFWFTGMVFGFILQKSRFCFTASMRDPMLTGSTSSNAGRTDCLCFDIDWILGN